MKNLKLRGMLGIVAASAVAVATPFLAFADTAFGTSTAPTVVTDFIAQVAVIIGIVVAAILGLMAALIGLGWGVAKFGMWIAGGDSFDFANASALRSWYKDANKILK